MRGAWSPPDTTICPERPPGTRGFPKNHFPGSHTTASEKAELPPVEPPNTTIPRPVQTAAWIPAVRGGVVHAPVVEVLRRVVATPLIATAPHDQFRAGPHRGVEEPGRRR